MGAGRWQSFRELLAEIFPDVTLHAPAFDQQVDRYIRAEYSASVDEAAARSQVATAKGSRAPKSERFDLFAAGAGFHQFVQILGGFFSERATTILLDEPDAHLFSRLQSRLYDVLMKLVDQGRQVISASHSPELIAAARPSSIISFANGTPRRLRVRADAAGTARALGAFENVGLLLIDAHERVVVVEDGSDEFILKGWLERVLSAERAKLVANRLVFLHAHGRPAPDRVQQMLETLQRAFAPERRLQVRAFVVADRDYRLDQELDAEKKQLGGQAFKAQTWHVWKRAEIENYLLVSGVLERFIARQLDERFASEPLFKPPVGEVGEVLEGTLEASRARAKGRLMDAFQRVERGLEASTCERRASALMETVWRGERRFEWCDAKEIVLPRLRDALHERWQIALPERDVIASFEDAEIPDDMRRACEALAEFALDRP